jgi:transcriptional regulator with XRE-family HTH domain
MPSKAPLTQEAVAAQLSRVGRGIRARRKALNVNATMAAEAAGMSRVTLHRIENGEASVTMGAYLNAMAALGLQLELTRPPPNAEPVDATAGVGLPLSIALADYPQLKRLAWHVPGVSELTPTEALNLYERNWRHLDQLGMEPHERDLLNALVKDHGKGYLLV